MIRFLTDEDFNIHILDVVRSRVPDLDIVRVQDVGLRTFRDPLILEYASTEDRIVLSYDVNTMENHAKVRLLEGHPIAGLILISQSIPIGRAVEEIVTAALCSRDHEWKNLIIHLPL